jgi:hypothetical protein
MSTLPHRRAPLWFYVLVAALLAVALRELAPAPAASAGAGGDAHPVSFAWWTILVTIVEAIWKGVEVAGRVTLAVLQYSVNLLWRFARNIAAAAHELADYAWTGLKAGWGLLRDTYENVLKPAWKFFWKWVDKVENWLQRTFEPLIRWLQKVRTWILDFYTRYIRPVLDIIDVTRRALRVLASLGLEWARTLDRKLGELEERITRPFLELVAKVNDVINLINRVVTLDGLFQKLAYVRTYARDVKDIWNQTGWGLHRPITAAEKDALHTSFARLALKTVERDIGEYMRTGGGPDAELLNGVAADVRVLFGGLS